MLAALAEAFGVRCLSGTVPKHSWIHVSTFGFPVQNPLKLHSQIHAVSTPRALKMESRLSQLQPFLSSRAISVDEVSLLIFNQQGECDETPPSLDSHLKDQ